MFHVRVEAFLEMLRDEELFWCHQDGRDGRKRV